MLKIKNFLRQDEGVTAMEYGLVAALIAVAILVLAQHIGTKLIVEINNISPGI